MTDSNAPAVSYAPNNPQHSANDKILFWGCFASLIATAFGFVIRGLVIGDMATEFGLDETQKGEILGVGIWPFSISIILFSLIIDRIGYGKAMVFALVCHVVSVIVTIFATGYWSLYIGTFIVALGNGTVEAVINPVVATMFSKEKSKWLNILHAGWPGGLVLGGILTIFLGADVDWRWKIGLILIPVMLYAIMLIGRTFPPNERVAAGVSYRDMLKEVGFLGAAIVAALIVWEITRVLEGREIIFHEMSANAKLTVRLVLTAILSIPFGIYTFSLGRPMFIFLLIIMMPLATTELGTDIWISELMKPAMSEFGLAAGWVLVYTSAIMMILRFFAGPIVHKLSPLGLLAVCAVIAAVGLLFLSKATGIMILAAATLYGIGKSFFWPTMLGVTAEQFPRGGALTLNVIAGVGMLGVGVVGTVFLGNIQDKNIDHTLEAQNPELHAELVGEEKPSVFGMYRPLDEEKVKELEGEKKEIVDKVQAKAKKNALATVAVFPVFMLVCYLILIGYFRTKGGYKAEMLTGHAAEDEKFTGGVEGPADR